MFVLVLLILNDSELDCQDNWNDHQAAVCKTMASSIVCVLFIQKKSGRWRQKVSHATGKCPDVLHTLSAHG
jgi:hypothetical protein